MSDKVLSVILGYVLSSQVAEGSGAPLQSVQSTDCSHGKKLLWDLGRRLEGLDMEDGKMYIESLEVSLDRGA